MLAYLVMHMQVGMRTQTRTEIAIQSSSEDQHEGDSVGNNCDLLEGSPQKEGARE